MKLKIIIIKFVLFFASTLVQADVYRYVDKQGIVVLTDRPKHSGYKRLVKTWKGWVEDDNSSSKKFNWLVNQKKFDPLIRRIAKNHQLPHTLLHAVIATESSYNPNAVSRVGAVGLMQLMPETAKRYGVTNRHDPTENVKGGTRYLKHLLGLFNNNLKLALAAYNAGENAIKKYNNQIPPYKETKRYVKKVMRSYQNYRKSMS